MPKIKDSDLQELTLPEVPDHLLDRWTDLVWIKYHPGEEADDQEIG